MSDFDTDDDFKRFQQEEEDIQPIDIGGGAAKGTPDLPRDLGMPIDQTTATVVDGTETQPDHVDQATMREYTLIHRGEYLDILKKDPTLKRVKIGAGWELRLLEEKKVDLDLSVFMLDRTDKTREDSDFIFYNNPTAYEGGIKHTGDSRTGAGEGDDETMIIDLNSIPFDILKIMFVLSIYDEENEGLNFSLVRDIFVRLVNDDDQNEICRFVFKDDELVGGNASYVACLIREGPKWVFEGQGKFVNAGLAEIATGYGIIVRELQSTGQ